MPDSSELFARFPRVKVAVPKEIRVGERRAAAVPESVTRLRRAGLDVVVQSGAGEHLFVSDAQFESAEAQVVGGDVLAGADVVLHVSPLTPGQIAGLRSGTITIGFVSPATNAEGVRASREAGVTAFSVELLPRISRAQSMDALSSMSTIAGYRAALIGADALGKFFPLLMTAAGTLPPARVLIVGAGVAGLQAIATARRLGAVVEAFDTRPVVKEQVQSLGASFVELELGVENAEAAGGYAAKLSEDAEHRERELIHKHVAQADVVITTALVPGKRAPVLITEDMVQDMRAGSVIVDLAAEQGGNCALTVPGEEAVRYEVSIIGPLNLPSTMPIHASQMYAKNITTLLAHLTRDHELNLDFNDEITRGTCITHNGEVLHEGARVLVSERAA